MAGRIAQLDATLNDERAAVATAAIAVSGQGLENVQLPVAHLKKKKTETGR